MEVWVLLGESYTYGIRGLQEFAAWVAGVYPDSLAAEAAKAEIIPLIRSVEARKDACYGKLHDNGLLASLWEAEEALLAVDPHADRLSISGAERYHYRVLPGTWRQHF